MASVSFPRPAQQPRLARRSSETAALAPPQTSTPPSYYECTGEASLPRRISGERHMPHERAQRLRVSRSRPSFLGGAKPPRLGRRTMRLPFRHRPLPSGSGPINTKDAPKFEYSRTPLADITRTVTHSSASENTATFYTPQACKISMRPHSQARCLAANLSEAIDLLTETESRRLLLLCAQSSSSLAAAIKDLAFTRTLGSEQAESRRRDCYSNLIDTFHDDTPSGPVGCGPELDHSNFTHTCQLHQHFSLEGCDPNMR